MQIALHAGVHNTDEDRLLKCLLKNRDKLREDGVCVPGPSRYRRLLRDALQAMDRAAPLPQARAVLLDAMIDTDYPARLVLSNDNFFCVPKLAIAANQFYPRAEEKLRRLRQLFPQDTLELFIGLRNPASLLPALAQQLPGTSFAQFLGQTDPRLLRWGEMVARLRHAVPDVSITSWCNEDTPLIWGQIVREIAGMDHNEMIVGGMDLLAEIMAPDGCRRFRTYLNDHPEMTEIQRRRVIAAFLDKYALPDQIEDSVDVPGWTPALIAELTEIYDEDVFQLSAIQGVQMITP